MENKSASCRYRCLWPGIRLARAGVLAHSVVVRASNCVQGHEINLGARLRLLSPSRSPLLRVKQRQLRLGAENGLGRQDLSGVTIEVGRDMQFDVFPPSPPPISMST